jgi:pimeloyl-ACP methyl ester carboxylesterase
MPFADSEGIRIYYEDRGEGEPALLCLPGWCNTHAIFAPLAELLELEKASRPSSSPPPW